MKAGQGPPSITAKSVRYLDARLLRAIILIASFESSHLTFRVSAIDPVSVLDAPQEYGTSTRDLSELVIVELNPTGAHTSFELLPIVFCQGPIHLYLQ